MQPLNAYVESAKEIHYLSIHSKKHKRMPKFQKLKSFPSFEKNPLLQEEVHLDIFSEYHIFLGEYNSFNPIKKSINSKTLINFVVV